MDDNAQQELPADPGRTVPEPVPPPPAVASGMPDTEPVPTAGAAPATPDAPRPGIGWTELVPVFITLLNGIGWLALYFLVLAPQAAQNQAQTRLLDEQLARLQNGNQKLLDVLDVRERGGRVQLDDANRRLTDLQIARLEAAALRLEDQLANLRTRTQATTDINAVRQSLRPNLTFGKFDFEFVSDASVRLEHEIRNIGANAATVTPPTVKLALTPINSSSPREQLLVQGRDFTARVYPLGMFQPGEHRRIDYTIELRDARLRGVPLHYVLEWTTTTDPYAVSSAAALLGRQVSAAELASLRTLSHSLVGSITFQR